MPWFSLKLPITCTQRHAAAGSRGRVSEAKRTPPYSGCMPLRVRLIGVLGRAQCAWLLEKAGECRREHNEPKADRELRDAQGQI